MNMLFALHFVLAGALFLSAGRAFGSPVPHQHRIPQTILVNGEQAEGVTVTQNGLALTFDCPNPQPYTALDQSSSGWACFDANTGSWLLNAMPPASVNVYTERPHGCGVPYDVYNYAYPDYTYYPEVFFGRPALSFGSGFGHGHDYYEDGREHGAYEHGGGRTGHGHGGHDGACHR
jgi:hypothetical protein